MAPELVFKASSTDVADGKSLQPVAEALKDGIGPSTVVEKVTIERTADGARIYAKIDGNIAQRGGRGLGRALENNFRDFRGGIEHIETIDGRE